MPECERCKVPITREGLCVFCLGDAFRLHSILNANTCQVCGKEGAELDAWWRYKGAYKKFRIHKRCEVIASQKKSYVKQAPKDSPSWQRIATTHKRTKEEERMPFLKAQVEAKFWFFFGKNRRGGFVVGKLIEAREAPPYGDRTRPQPCISIRTNVAHGGKSYPLTAVCTDGAAWFDIKDHIKGAPTRGSIIGSHIAIISLGASPDGRYGEVAVCVNGTLEGVLSEVRESEVYQTLRDELGEEWDISHLLWFPDIDSELAKWSEKNTGFFSDDIPF